MAELVEHRDLSPASVGLAFLPFTLGVGLLSRFFGGPADTFGARRMLVAGAVCASAAYIWMALAQGATLVPGVVLPQALLGISFAVMVAPLTASVLSSVTASDEGLASGINNAIARVAGVLAIAILGIVLVKSFSFDLNRSLAGRSVPPDTLQYVYANETKLAGVDLPSGLEPATAMLLRTSISRAFVFGFRIAMLICAGLSLASALVAWLMIPAKAG